MKKLPLLTIILFLLITSASKAQTFEVPKDYVLKEKSDYAKYNADVVKAVEWMVQTPSNEQGIKRRQVGTFLLSWMTGSPDVNININDAVTKLADKNPDMLLIYMGGCAKYAIENPTDKDKLRPCKAGIKTVLDKYQNDKSSKKDKAIEKLITIDKEGTLDAWLAQNFL